MYKRRWPICIYVWRYSHWTSLATFSFSDDLQGNEHLNALPTMTWHLQTLKWLYAANWMTFPGEHQVRSTYCSRGISMTHKISLSKRNNPFAQGGHISLNAHWVRTEVHRPMEPLRRVTNNYLPIMLTEYTRIPCHSLMYAAFSVHTSYILAKLFSWHNQIIHDHHIHCMQYEVPVRTNIHYT